MPSASLMCELGIATPAREKTKSERCWPQAEATTSGAWEKGVLRAISSRASLIPRNLSFRIIKHLLCSSVTKLDDFCRNYGNNMKR